VTIRINRWASSSCARRQVQRRKRAARNEGQQFHTKNLEEGAGHPNVYHDNDQCADGKRIKSWNRESGIDGRPKCDECKGLS
jgi:hypothetical protein